MHFQPTINTTINTLQNLAFKGISLGGKVFIDEEQFFVGILQMRKALPEVLVQPHSEGRISDDSMQIFREIDNTEQFVERGTPRFFGRVLVNKQNYLEHIERLRATLESLEHDLKR